MFPQDKFSNLPAASLDAVFTKKSAGGKWAELYANHGMALRGEPEQIQTFPAQRHKYPVCCGQPEIWPKFYEVRIDGLLVKGNLTVAPGLLPEFIVAPGHCHVKGG